MTIQFYLIKKKVPGLSMTQNEEKVFSWFEKNRHRSYVLYLVASHYVNKKS